MLYINIPKNIDLNIYKNYIVIKGLKGQVIKKNTYKVKYFFDKNLSKLYLYGNSYKNLSLCLNMISQFIYGCNFLYFSKISLKGIGYKIFLEDNNLLRLKLGYSNEVYYQINKQIIINISKKDTNSLILSCYNKQLLNEVLNEIYSLKKPDAYKGKGFLIKNKKIILKQGKRNKT